VKRVPPVVENSREFRKPSKRAAILPVVEIAEISTVDEKSCDFASRRKQPRVSPVDEIAAISPVVESTAISPIVESTAISPVVENRRREYLFGVAATAVRC
jgi:hypothetical protein